VDKKQFQSVGVTLSPRMIDVVDQLAASRGVSRSEAIRIALEVGIPLLKAGLSLNAERAVTILEHTQLALSLIVQEQYPADAEHLIAQALSNVREHHG
jgi:metal-responsive CopG/Arc/MetJ family transcriptional regulator